MVLIKRLDFNNDGRVVREDISDGNLLKSPNAAKLNLNLSSSFVSPRTIVVNSAASAHLRLAMK